MVAAACTSPAGAPPAIDSDNATPNGSGNHYGWFEAGLEWRGDFGDPTIIRVGSTYYAYASPVGGRYLPVLTSTDLAHWFIHPRWTSAPPPWAGGDPNNDPAIPAEIRASSLSAVDKWNMNEGLVSTAAWGLWHDQGPWIKKDMWAPGVTNLAGTWYAYSAVKISDGGDDPNLYGRFCLTVASAPTAFGPFRDITGGTPLICDNDPSGSIDPQPFHDPVTGQDYLTWKAAGRRTQPGVTGYPSALRSVLLGSDGRPVPGSPWITMLATNEGSWEGDTIESPSMVNYGGTYYVFYSGNSSLIDGNGNSRYASGYAICPSGPRGACYRPTNAPLLASNPAEVGPGGGTAFVDGSGELRYAYSFYWPGENRPDQWNSHPRRLRITQISRNGDGTLHVGS